MFSSSPPLHPPSLRQPLPLSSPRGKVLLCSLSWPQTHKKSVWLCFLTAETKGMPHDIWLESPFFNCVVLNVF